MPPAEPPACPSGPPDPAPASPPDGRGDAALCVALALLFWLAAALCAAAARWLHHSHLHTLRAYAYGALTLSMLSAAAAAFWTARIGWRDR